MESVVEMETFSSLNWENCLIEVLCMVFEKLDTVSLVKCMFISRLWNEAALFTAKKQNRWEDILDKFTIEKCKMTQMKSVDMSLRDLFENTILWAHSNKAELSLHHTYDISDVKHIHVFKTKLIIVTSNTVKYFDIIKSELIREIKIVCLDFMENENTILIVTPGTGNCKILHLFGKSNMDDFNLLRCNKTMVYNVIKYRLDTDGCFIIDNQSHIILYEYKDLKWNVQFLARYYGNSKTVRCLHIFKEEFFILMKWCQLFCANKQSGFDGPITVLIHSEEDQVVNVYVQMFHKFGFLYGVELSEFRFVRKNIDNNNVFIIQCPNLTCSTEHGDILLLGYSDGKIQLFMPREADEKAALIRTFNITEVTGLDLDDKSIKSLDVFDETNQHNVFVATNSHVFHLILKHTNMDSYLWSVFPQRISV